MFIKMIKLSKLSSGENILVGEFVGKMYALSEQRKRK